MSQESYIYTNGRDPVERWQAQLTATARAFPYPPTPDLAVAVRRRLSATARPMRGRPISAPLRRQLAWVVVVFLILGGLLAVPAVRAGIVEFLQIGVVRIWLGPTPTTTPTPTVPTPAGTRRPPTAMPFPSRTPFPSPTPLSSVLDLAGETTLDDARARAGFSIGLPTYPDDLGSPDHVFMQDLDGTAVVLVWLDPADPSQVRLSLHVLVSDVIASKGLEKGSPYRVEFTRVNGREAVWTTGPYLVLVRNGNYEFMRLIEGHVLIWADGPLTYRLETDGSLEEAVRIAESLE